MNNLTADRSTTPIFALALVCFYLIFSPVWMPGMAPRQYDDARCLELILLASVAISLLFPPFTGAVTEGWVSLDRLARLLIVVFLAGGALSTLASASPKFGVLEIALMGQLVALFLCVWSAVRRGKEYCETLLAAALSAGASLFVLKFYVTYVMYIFEGKDFPWLTPFLDFANVRFFSQYQAYSLLLILLPTFLLPLSKPWRIVLYVMAANFWALQWILGTRAVWFGFATATLTVVAVSRNGRLAWLRAQAIPVALGGLIYVVFSAVISFLPGATLVPDKVGAIIQRSQDSVLERIALWKRAVDVIREHPLFGVGPGQFGLQDYPMGAAHPHNTPLQLLSEYGLPAGAAGIGIGILLLVLAGHALKEPGSSTQSDVAGKSLAAALIMGLTDSLFSGNLLMPHSQVMFCVVSGWLLARTQQAARPASNLVNPANSSMKITIVALALLAVTVTTVLSVRYLRVAADIGPYAQRGNPHFWHYGRFQQW